jgi:predicted transcriptional regulator
MVKRLSGSSLNLTELSLLTGLNFGMTKACVDYLMSAGLVRAELEKGIRYSATARGRSFLEDSQKALSYLNEQEKKLK